MTMAQPHRFDERANRTLECKDALKAAFEELADDAVNAGWDRFEVALALSELAEHLVRTTAESAGSEADIAIAKAIFEIKRAF
jgi:glutamate/tyrosine decarboxylase-like PLP-dependent enzyme